MDIEENAFAVCLLDLALIAGHSCIPSLALESPPSSGYQNIQKTNQLRHPTLGTEQLLNSWIFCSQTAIIGITGWQHVSRSNKFRVCVWYVYGIYMVYMCVLCYSREAQQIHPPSKKWQTCSNVYKPFVQT